MGKDFNTLVFREHAPEMDDDQILDYILSCSAARKREELRGALMEQFGSLKNILEASPEQLLRVNGIGEQTAKLISSFIPVMKAWQKRASYSSAQIKTSKALEEYCLSFLSGCRNEQFWVICVNVQCFVIGKRCISEGTVSEVQAYPRLVMETALNYNAHSVFFAHNHPGGTCAPSAEDISSTIQLQKLLNGVGILVLDHMIVAGNQTYSMARHGDMDFRANR